MISHRCLELQSVQSPASKDLIRGEMVLKITEFLEWSSYTVSVSDWSKSYIDFHIGC